MGTGTALVAAIIFEVSVINRNDIRNSHLDLNRRPALFKGSPAGEWATFLRVIVAKAKVFKGLLHGEQSRVIIFA